MTEAPDSLWSIDLFRCESAILRSHWVLVVMDHYTRRIVGFGIHAGTVDGRALCRMFTHAIRGLSRPTRLSSDHDPLSRFHPWCANLRVLQVTEVKSVPYVPLSHPFVERLIGTLRRECVDQLLFWSASDLADKLVAFQDFYNAHRAHASLDGRTPRPDTKGCRTARPLPMGRALPWSLSDADRGVTSDQRRRWRAGRRARVRRLSRHSRAVRQLHALLMPSRQRRGGLPAHGTRRSNDVGFLRIRHPHPHQIRTWRFPPSGSSADVARDSRATTVRSCGDMIRRRRSAGHGSLRTITPTRAAFARPGPGGYPFPGVIARMQPSDSLIPIGLGSGRPLPSAYPGARATRSNEGLPGVRAVLFQRAVVVDPAGCGALLAHGAGPAVAFRLHEALGTQEDVVSRLQGLRPTRSRTYASATALPRSPQGSLPAWVGWPLTGRGSHPLDDTQGFMTYSSIPLDRPAWPHHATTPRHVPEEPAEAVSGEGWRKDISCRSVYPEKSSRMSIASA